MGGPASVLVTGAGSGFGLLTCRTLLRSGYSVLATLRDVEGRNADAVGVLRRAAAEGPGKLHVLELDVTRDESVRDAVDSALEIAGRIDFAINNAGIGVGGHAEGFTVDQWRDIFEVNVLGVQRVNRAVLPSMRAAGSGLLVHVSSVMGRVVIPFAAPYTASKWALEGMVESYRYELAGTGVDVAIVEPGGFMTGFAERMVTPADESRIESYGPLADAPDKVWGPMMEMLQGDEAPDPQAVPDAILKLMETPAGRRPLRTVVDPLTGGEGVSMLNGTSRRIQSALLRSFGMTPAGDG